MKTTEETQTTNTNTIDELIAAIGECSMQTPIEHKWILMLAMKLKKAHERIDELETEFYPSEEELEQEYGIAPGDSLTAVLRTLRDNPTAILPEPKSLCETLNSIKSGSFMMGLKFLEFQGPLDPDTTRQDVVEFLMDQLEYAKGSDDRMGTAIIACRYAVALFDAIKAYESV